MPGPISYPSPLAPPPLSTLFLSLSPSKMTYGACSPLTPLSQLSVVLYARVVFRPRVTCLSLCLLLYLCSPSHRMYHPPSLSSPA